MSTVFMAPHNLPQATIVLPNPELNNEEGLQQDVVVKYAEDSTIYTTVRTSKYRLLTLEFILRRAEKLELEEFVKAYYSYRVRMIDFKGRAWAVYFQDSVITFTSTSRNLFVVPLTLEGELL